MQLRWLLCVPAALAAPAAVFSQGAQDSVVQTAEMVVNATYLPSTAAGATRIDLQPDVGPSADAWELLSRGVANLHVSGSGAGGYGGLFSLRGLANTPYFSEPAVTVYFADIPLPSSFTYPTGIFGFNSVAVFRGPMGTEFGRATDGGVVTLAPQDGGSSAGELLMGCGSYDSRQIAATARTPAAGKLDVEVDADYDARNGYITNQQLGIRVDDQENENAYARFRLRPAAGDELTFEVLGTRSRDGAQPLVPLGGPLFDVSRPKEGATDLDSLGAALKGSFALPSSATLTTVTSFTDWRMNPYQSLLVLPPPLENEILLEQKSWNEEIRFQTDPLASLRWEVGAWLSKGTTDSGVNRSILNLFPIQVSDSVLGDQSSAVFGEAVFAPDKAWRITAGLRAEVDEKNFVRYEHVPTPGLDYVASGRYDALLPRLAADWTVAADSHVEASVALGLRPGGFSSFTENLALSPFAAERSTAYSVGWDTSLAQHAVDVAVRAFYNDISNLQIERSFSQPDYFVATAPRAHSVGGEVEGRWHPSVDWTVGVSAGWSEVRLDTFFDPLTGLNESGDAAPNAPLYNADLEVTYRPGTGWFAAGQLSAVGRTYYDERQSPKYTQNAYALAGLRAGYETARWTLTLYGENLANKGYYELIIPGVNSGNPGAPRNVGARVAVRF
jgi:iron complex outermembrane receptor protein